MTTMVGMDTELVTDLAHGLLAAADRMDGVARQLRGVLGELSSRAWWGRDCVEFSETWQQAHDPALVALATRLRELGHQALVEVAEQERASGVTSTTSGGLLSAPPSTLTGTQSSTPGVGVPTATTPLGTPTPVGTLAPGNRPDRDLLELATAVYPDGRLTDAASRYRELTADELRQLGVTERMLVDERTGFAARIYRAEDGRTVLSFRGSDGIDLKDVGGTNIPNGLNLPSPQGGQAIALAQRVAAGVGAGNLTFTGHSLGGHLAAAGAVATGARAVTFNSARLGDADFARALIASGRDGNVPGVIAKLGQMRATPLSPLPYLYDPHAAVRREINASGQIRNYSTTGEPLNVVQWLRLGPRPLGEQVTMTDPAPGLLKRHGPDGLLETYDNTFRRASGGR